MSKLYWTNEVALVLREKIHELTDKLINDQETTEEQDAELVARIRICRQFADDVIATMEYYDRKDDERRAAAKEAENNAG